MAIAYDLYKTIGNIDICIKSELLEVKVPIVFLGTVGFSLYREGRYSKFLMLISALLLRSQLRAWPGLSL